MTNLSMKILVNKHQFELKKDLLLRLFLIVDNFEFEKICYYTEENDQESLNKLEIELRNKYSKEIAAIKPTDEQRKTFESWFNDIRFSLFSV